MRIFPSCSMHNIQSRSLHTCLICRHCRQHCLQIKHVCKGSQLLCFSCEKARLVCLCLCALQESCHLQVKQDVSSGVVCRSCTGGKTEDFIAAAKLMHKAGGKVKVPTYLVPATQKVWMDVYGMPVPGCDGKTASQIFQEAGCDTPASPSCAACLGGPKDTYARMNKPEVCVSTTNR